ncbi:MAG: GatB/YqeY domain-containing protein [Firmicutes bacterium]|nr:GatB/YqeY domain-containing protein [Bacillota bacterium]
MSLREQLNEDLKTAMRAKDQARLVVIRGIKAGILAAETRSERITLDDDGILQVIAKELKERRDALPDFERSGRQDLVDKLNHEMELLSQYLPTPLTSDELRRLVNEAVQSVGASGPKDMGKVMAWLTPKTRGRADGREVSALVKEQLASLA